MTIESVAKAAAASYQGREATNAQAPEIAVESGVIGKSAITKKADIRPIRKGLEDVSTGISTSENDTEERKQVQNDSIKKAVDAINKKSDTEAIFGIHDETDRVTIKIVDKKSKEVIKEFPPEKTLDMIAKVWEIAGLIVDEKK